MVKFGSIGELPSTKNNSTFLYQPHIDLTTKSFSFNLRINSATKGALISFGDVGTVLASNAMATAVVGGGAATAVVGGGAATAVVGGGAATAVVGAGISAFAPGVTGGLGVDIPGLGVTNGVISFDGVTAFGGFGIGTDSAFLPGVVSANALGFATAGVFQGAGVSAVLPGFGTAGTFSLGGVSATLPGNSIFGDFVPPPISSAPGPASIPGTSAWNMNPQFLGEGSNFGDRIEGTLGDNLIYGYGGDDVINGGLGIDTVAFRGKIEEYRYLFCPLEEGKLIIADQASDRDGIDRLTGVEFVKLGSDVYDIENIRKLALLQSEPKIVPEVKRLYNKLTGTHLFTSNETEVAYLVGGSLGWVNEGDAYKNSDNATESVYRFNIDGRHFYTASETEKDIIINSQPDYNFEGEVHKAYGVNDTRPDNVVPIYRFFNSSTGAHVYSSSPEEQNILLANPLFADEGIAWYSEPVI